jgi:hypothetical protein
MSMPAMVNGRPSTACVMNLHLIVVPHCGAEQEKVGHRVDPSVASNLMFPLGRLLRRHREQARLTQEELAERAGVSARTISATTLSVKNRATRPNVMITIPMN